MQARMASVKLKRTSSWNSYEKVECSAENIIKELREKMSRLKFRLLDYQNQNQMLRKELLLAKKVINTEVTKASDEKFHDLLNQTDFLGRQEQILILKDKLNELQNRIKELEDKNVEKSPEDGNRGKSSKIDKLDECKIVLNTKKMDKELQYVLENSCQIKRKLEMWKKRSAELNNEAELLRLELNRLLEKSKEDRSVHVSYHNVDKELRARQSERLAMRSKLDLEKTRNEQLTEELKALQEDLSIISSKINDDKVLIDALKNQQGYLIDLLERQKLICERDNRKFQDDLREIHEKHATNNHVLDHITDIVEEKRKTFEEMQEAMNDEISVEEKDGEESTTISMTESDLTSQSELQQSPVPANELPAGNEEAPTENEIIKLNEEIERYKDILESINEEIKQLTNIAVSNKNKSSEWMAQLFQTNYLLVQKNAELSELGETSRKLQKFTSLDKKESSAEKPNFIEEMQRRSDVLEEERQFLVTLWDMLISNKENSLDVFFISIKLTKKQFIDAIVNVISEENNLDDNEEPLPAEEQS